MNAELRRSDLRLLWVWIRAGLRTLVRTPRAAFTFVFPAVLLVFVDGTASGTAVGAGGRVDAVLHAVAGRLRPRVRLLHEPGLHHPARTRAGHPEARARHARAAVRLPRLGDRGGAPVRDRLGRAARRGRGGGVRRAPVPGAASGRGRHAHRRQPLPVRALGLAVSSFVGNAETAPVVANITLLPLAFISGVFAPLHGAPDWLSTLASVFPLRHLVDAFSATFSPHTTGGGFRPGDLAALVAWAIAGGAVAVRRFRWEVVEPGPGARQREPRVRPAAR